MTPNNRIRKTSTAIAGGASAKATHASAIAQLRESANRGELVAVIGTGVSIALADGNVPVLTWKGLIRNGIEFAERKGLISASQATAWTPHLDSKDIDDLLGVAEFVAHKLSAPDGDLYARWLERNFRNLTVTNETLKSALLAVRAANVPLCTLNYDTMLEDVTKLPAINLIETNKVVEWMRRESQSILHLHGTWDVPNTCILGLRSYETTLGNDIRDLIQRSLSSFKRLLFLGCGDTFADPNFSALIKWLREKMGAATPQHYALITDHEIAIRNRDKTWLGFVEPLRYGTRHELLAGFLQNIFEKRPARQLVVTRQPKMLSETASAHRTLLNHYRAFLTADCGQMTIEGIRADMEIGQRRFDLERLFVPLDILPSPPSFSKSDPAAEEKREKWMAKHGRAIPFGKALARHRRIALLALPGGGKTLLLKRVAVAYSDRSRRELTRDSLPMLDVLPVMIRCREWRQHIRSPILTLLQYLPEITGKAELSGIREALVPLLKEGRVLLLVDGLDEIHEDADRATFVDHLEAFLDEFKETRLVVSSREAGFNLVAPCLSRFCVRLRIAPLDDGAIRLLCDHWRRLMSGESPESISEMKEVTDHILRNPALRRLAENPLLLTMLLVVRHGAGRLPPDRVSLYGRAVEVLLDTWNIKGHDPLSLKEAVPQLACVAFELMRSGRQTATEKELLQVLEDARDRVPQIRRYAKDSPHDFLKRVELRSSLLLEAGHQVEAGQTVPFYQFRHLTFQEYLAAVAAAEGHYLTYKTRDTVLTPLMHSLKSETWKEVIPMAAVLARKQAEPLIGALIKEAASRQWKVPNERHHPLHSRLPAPIGTLLQCLTEEAEATSETLTNALRIVATYAEGCDSQDDWQALIRGPFGEDFFHQAWLLFSGFARDQDSLRTCTYVAYTLWRRLNERDRDAEIQRLLASDRDEDLSRGLFIIAGSVEQYERYRDRPP